jgi:hypothetical protein
MTVRDHLRLLADIAADLRDACCAEGCADVMLFSNRVKCESLALLDQLGDPQPARRRWQHSGTRNDRGAVRRSKPLEQSGLSQSTCATVPHVGTDAGASQGERVFDPCAVNGATRSPIPTHVLASTHAKVLEPILDGETP